MTDPQSPIFSIPKDFRSRIEFRALEDEVGYIPACAAILTLWGELAYLAETQRLGFMADAQAKRMIIPKLQGMPSWSWPNDPMETLCRTQNITKEEGGYISGPFVQFNEHLDVKKPEPRAQAAFNQSVTAIRMHVEREAEEQAIFFDRTKILRPDGKQMEDDEFKRCLMLIRLVDHQYSRPERLPKDYSLGLLQDAYAVLKIHSRQIIDGVCYYVHRARLRKDLAIPERTEELLREFDRFAKAFGKSGVLMYAKRKKKNA